MFTWRDAVLALSFVLSALTAWLRLNEHLEKRRQARRNLQQIEANPVDPLHQGSDPDAATEATGHDETDEEPGDGQDPQQ